MQYVAHRAHLPLCVVQGEGSRAEIGCNTFVLIGQASSAKCRTISCEQHLWPTHKICFVRSWTPYRDLRQRSMLTSTAKPAFCKVRSVHLHYEGQSGGGIGAVGEPRQLGACVVCGVGCSHCASDKSSVCICGYFKFTNNKAFKLYQYPIPRYFCHSEWWEKPTWICDKLTRSCHWLRNQTVS